MRLVVGLAFSVVTAWAALAPGEAHAGNCDTGAVSTCVNSDTFWPHAGPAQFASLGATDTVAPGNVSFGIVTSYLSRPIVLKTPSPGPNGSDSFAINDQVNGSFLFAFGVLERLQLDAILPVTFGQGGGGVSAITGGPGVKDTAMRDARFGVVYALLPRARVHPFSQEQGAKPSGVYALTVRSELSVPTGDATQFAGERGVAWVPTVVGDYRRDRFFAAVEVGARVRASSDILGSSVGSQGIVAAGIGADIFPRREIVSVALEARVLPGLGSSVAPAEWMLSARSAPFLGGDLGFQLGGGGGIPLSDPAAVTTPRFRFLLGIRYAPVARDSDGDGILDKDDKCPYTHGAPRSGDGDGCPEPKAPLPEATPPEPARAPEAVPSSPAPATSSGPSPLDVSVKQP